MHILFITSNYPQRSRPYHGAFVQELVRAVARTGTKATVIRPLSHFDRRFGSLDPVYLRDFVAPDNPIDVWSPRYWSASGKNLLLFNTNSITQHCYERCVVNAVKKVGTVPDVLYGHFLYPSGALAVQLGTRMKRPSIVAVGDDAISDHFAMVPQERCIEQFKSVCGIVAVSKKNKQECQQLLAISEEKIIELPNGIDRSLFYPRNREEMRRKYGFPMDRFLIAFTGHFIERKGPDRLLKAVSGLKGVGLLLIGEGPIRLSGESIVFQGVLEHKQVPEVLSAADIFALPTLMEGSCNAILEALACGLPVVTSKGEFNDDIVDDTVALRIDPMNTEEIRGAAIALHRNPMLRDRMSQSAVEKIQKFDIETRARRIIDWIAKIGSN